MRRLVRAAGAFALLAAFSVAPAAAKDKQANSAAADTQIVCKDGTKSEAKHSRGACSGHGGIQSETSTASASTGSKRDTRSLGAGPSRVWVNLPSQVYHCAGDRFYGKTQHGEYMSEAQAKDKGYRPDHGKACAERAK